MASVSLKLVFLVLVSVLLGYSFAQGRSRNANNITRPKTFLTQGILGGRWKILKSNQPVQSDLWDPRRNTLVPTAFLFEMGKSLGNGIVEENDK